MILKLDMKHRERVESSKKLLNSKMCIWKFFVKTSTEKYSRMVGGSIGYRAKMNVIYDMAI